MDWPAVLLAVAATAVVQSEVYGGTVLAGVGCGVAATQDVALPATATDVHVKQPQPGATTDESQLTHVEVLGTTVRLTAIGAGPEICDPEDEEDTPPEQRPWDGAYNYDVAYKERVSVGYKARAKVVRRPSRVTIQRVASVVHVRWRSFGGRTAVGYGTLRSARSKVVLTRPSRCVDTGGTVYYGRIGFYTKGRLVTRGDPGCSEKPQRV